jgi:penicillin-binding protein 1A
MRVAVARRPVEAFDTEVKLPDWQLEDEGEAYMGEPGEGGLVDENGMPIELPATAPVPDDDVSPPPAEDGPVLDQQWIEEQTGRRGSGDNGAAPRNGGQSKAPATPKVAPPVVKTTPPRGQQPGDSN